MTTRAQFRRKLVDLRRSLEAPFAAAQARGDTAEMNRLEGIAGEIDDVLDAISLIGLAELAASVTALRNRIDGHTADVTEAASGFGGLTLAELQRRVEEVLGQSSEEEVPEEETSDEDAVTAGGGTPAPVATPDMDFDPEPAPEPAPGTEPPVEPAPPSEPAPPAVPAAVPAEPVVAEDPGIDTAAGLVLTEAHMIGLWKRSVFPIDDRGIIVFGLRGCLPVDTAGTGFAARHEIVLSPVNYQTMNCTLGQWRPGGGLALFPGSTVPYGATVVRRIASNGVGVNQMGRGRYTRYRANWHKRSEGPNGHWALIQECAITLQRTGDDADYDLLDRWEVGKIAGDNIHCAFHMGSGTNIPDARFSSAGCQTVAGTVQKGVRGSERGPWKKFIDPFQDRLGNQKSTEYVLFDASEALQMIKNQYRGKSVVLRMGSAGPLVARLQRALARTLDRPLSIDGDFGPGTFQAVIDFQTIAFGQQADDGVVGSETAAELGFPLPQFDFADAISGGPGFTASDLEGPGPAGAGTGSPAVVPDDADQPIAWGAVTRQKHGPEFNAKVRAIARRLRCDPSNLMAVMAFETGGKFTPDVVNQAGSGATGLIQFMPATAAGLGTTTSKLAQMTAFDQLDFVEKHFKSVVGSRPLPALSDVYMAVLLPAAVGKPESHVLFRRPSRAFTQNRGLDANGDGVITKAEATAKVQAKLVAGLKENRLG